MSDTKKMPMWGWGWSSDKDERKEQWEDFKSNMESFWDQMQEMQRTYMEARKEQWEKVFPAFLEMQDSFAAFLPDELPTLPGMPSFMSPKECMDKLKEFEEMANEHAMEQADSVINYRTQAAEKTKEIVSDAVKNVEDNLK